MLADFTELVLWPAWLVLSLCVLVLCWELRLERRTGRSRRPGYLPTSPASTATRRASKPSPTPRRGRSDGTTAPTRTPAAASSSSGAPGDRLAGSAILRARAEGNKSSEPGDCGCNQDSHPGPPPVTVGSDTATTAAVALLLEERPDLIPVLKRLVEAGPAGDIPPDVSHEDASELARRGLIFYSPLS